ncbi:MAG: hypothetical protein JNJ57_11115 [Saprospiraceae bacterium]|nr:hypothetical protein [Saprospiraceae bacterium]
MINWKRIVELTARWYVFAMLNLYAIGKITGGQFYRKGHLPEAITQKTVDQLSGFELAWTFFGYSKFYIVFIGLAQLIGAVMLLWDRTKLLGAVLLLGILLNIIVVDFEFGVGDAIVSAIFYFSLLLLIVGLNWKQVQTVWAQLTQKATRPYIPSRAKMIQFAISLGLLVIVFFLETLFLKMVGFNRF